MRHLLILLPFALSACGDDFGDDPDTTCDEENEACGPGDCEGEGASMLPGADCLACHDTPGEEGGVFTAGGTVFSDLDGTDGLSDAIIRITDADGQTIELTSNGVGNFYTSKSLVPPLLAEIEVGGNITAMQTPVDTGACSSCHLCGGAAGGKLYGS